MISGNVPKHLTAGVILGFQNAIRDTPAQWNLIAERYDLTGASDELVDLGAPPMPVENKTGVTVQDFVERSMRVAPRSWDLTVFISHNAIRDDRTNSLERRVRAAGSNFNRHMDKIVFQALNAGDTTTYATCYDGQPLFSDTHVDPGADYQVAQDNKNALALTLDNFETVAVAASTRLDDRGEQSGIMPNLLVVPPALDRTATQITGNPLAFDAAAANEINPYNGRYTHIVSPYLDTTAWFLLSTTGTFKPILLVMREAPNLQAAWFDPNKPDGGHYYWKFYARYWVAYTDWRLATQGNT